MRHKIIIALLLALVLPIAAFATGGQEAAADEPITITWSSVSVPDDAHSKGMLEFERVVEEVSGGQIQVEIFLSGELYNQGTDLPAMRRGNLDMAYTGPNWIAEFMPYVSMFAAPYIFDSYEHMSQFFNGPTGAAFFDDVAEQVGVRPLGAYYLGTRQLNLRDIGREVRTPADMQGVKLRMPGTEAWQRMGRALGANPTPLAFTEVYLALQSGTIDAQDNPLPTNFNAKFYEVTEYIVLTNHFVNPIMPTINEERWQSFTDEQRDWIMTGIDAAKELVDTLNLQQEAELLDFFEAEGMTIITPDQTAFKEHALSYIMNDEALVAEWNMDLFEEIQALGARLR